MAEQTRTLDEVNAELAEIAAEMSQKWGEYMNVEEPVSESQASDNPGRMLGWAGDVMPRLDRLLAERAELDVESLAELSFDEIADALGWDDTTREHARDSMDVDYGAECVLLTHNGREIRCPAHPDPCDYVRICEAGFELAYWNMVEMGEDPEEVMGAIMGAATAGIEPAPRQDLRAILVARQSKEVER